MRYAYSNIVRDGNGRVILGATVSVYLAGTTTVASVYTASSGGTAVNSVTSSTTDASFTFYVDTGDYSLSQLFKVIISKTNYTTFTSDNISVFPQAYYVIPTASAEQTCPSGAAQTAVAHGLGAIPKYYRVVLRCKTGELGYSAGDEVDATCFQGSTVSDATNITFLNGGAIYVSNKSTSAYTAVTPANWKLVFYYY